MTEHYAEFNDDGKLIAFGGKCKAGDFRNHFKELKTKLGGKYGSREEITERD